MKDFNNSIKDGRLQNLYNLDQLSQEKKRPMVRFHDGFFFYPCQVLLVEGKFLRKSKHNFSPDVIKSHLNQLRYHFPSLQIIQTASVSESAQTIIDLALDLPSDLRNQFHDIDVETIHATDQKRETIFHSPAPLSKKRKRVSTFKLGDMRRHHFLMLRHLPGITIPWAKAFLENNITAMDLCIAVNDSELQAIRKGGRSSKIVEYFPSSNLKLLKQVCESLQSRKKWLGEILAMIPYVKEQPAQIVSSIIIDELLKENSVPLSESLPIAVAPHKIDPQTIQRILAYWNFKPRDHQAKIANQ